MQWFTHLYNGLFLESFGYIAVNQIIVKFRLFDYCICNYYPKYIDVMNDKKPQL